MNSENEEKQEPGSPILDYIVTCPICEFEEVHFYALRAKALPSRPNIFEVPLYESSQKYHVVDFNELGLSVCPKCFYVGSKRSDFHYTDKIQNACVRANLEADIYKYWKENRSEIELQIADCFVDDESFLHPRTEDGVLASIKLGIHRATKEIQFKKPFSYYRRAKYKIRHAYLFRKFYKKESPEILQEALADLEEVFRLSDFPEKSYEHEVCFLIVGISLFLENEQKAQEYLRVMEQTKMDLSQKARQDPKINLNEILKWLNRAKNLWQARKDLDTWETMRPTRV
ncbi:MAG: DUF2225 domain-containing protein [Leptospiraceae bacterium]|nr:DUF2225 domain-containing protein [Leptospiraceae bacterium]